MNWTCGSVQINSHARCLLLCYTSSSQRTLTSGYLYPLRFSSACQFQICPWITNNLKDERVFHNLGVLTYLRDMYYRLNLTSLLTCQIMLDLNVNWGKFTTSDCAYSIVIILRALDALHKRVHQYPYRRYSNLTPLCILQYPSIRSYYSSVSLLNKWSSLSIEN